MATIGPHTCVIQFHVYLAIVAPRWATVKANPVEAAAIISDTEIWCQLLEFM